MFFYYPQNRDPRSIQESAVNTVLSRFSNSCFSVTTRWISSIKIAIESFKIVELDLMERSFLLILAWESSWSEGSKEFFDDYCSTSVFQLICTAYLQAWFLSWRYLSKSFYCLSSFGLINYRFHFCIEVLMTGNVFNFEASRFSNLCFSIISDLISSYSVLI